MQPNHIGEKTRGRGVDGDGPDRPDTLSAMTSALRDLIEDGYVERVDRHGVVFAGPDLHGIRILDSHFEEADLEGMRLIGCRLDGVEFRSAKGSDVSLAKSSLQDVAFVECRVGAAQAYGGTWMRCRIVGGKVDYLNLRGASISRLAFEKAVIGELDLSEAKVESLSFASTTIGKLVLTGARSKRLDLRGVTLRGLESNPEGLNGTVMSEDQVTELSPVLAEILGIRIA